MGNNVSMEEQGLLGYVDEGLPLSERVYFLLLKNINKETPLSPDELKVRLIAGRRDGNLVNVCSLGAERV